MSDISQQMGKQRFDVIVVGAGIAGLAAASLLANRGLEVGVLERNWIPGGCTSSYPRHGYIFEAGATTLVGLDEGMPLRRLLDEIHVRLAPVRLETPMKVHLADRQVVTRHENLERWIAEAERAFGVPGQRAFWEHCMGIAQNVWRTSTRQLQFPPSRISDLVAMARNFRLGQLRLLPKAFVSMEQLLERFGLHENLPFRAFVDEQLLITAQNHAPEVNALFGATALCYTNFGNYYLHGGMMSLVKPLVDFIEGRGGRLLLRHEVVGIRRMPEGYAVQTRKHGGFQCRFMVSAIPLNNVLPLFGGDLQQRWESSILPPGDLRSAFSMGVAFRRRHAPDCLHHQIHLGSPLPQIGGNSIFLSLSHPLDTSRCKADECVASISTHIFDPGRHQVTDKAEIESCIVDVLVQHGFLEREDILYRHSSSQQSWEKWTGRAHGFVGGYPQYMGIKPWKMKDARLDGKGAYLCGDSTYPGQGIPGACLSGIIAVEKLASDHRL